jgi:alpha-tubulin suppressor-like RCC1 family protein
MKLEAWLLWTFGALVTGCAGASESDADPATASGSGGAEPATGSAAAGGAASGGAAAGGAASGGAAAGGAASAREGNAGTENGGAGTGGAGGSAAALGIAEVSAGTHHTCARKTDGSVWCWGRNESGQIGVEPEPTIDPEGFLPRVTLPAHVAGLPPALDVDLGETASCAVVSDGAVWCWGRSPSAPDQASFQPVQVAGVTNARQVAVGDHSDHACALDKSGAVYCWGKQWNGGHVPLPAKVVGLPPAIAIDAGEWITCALSSTQEMWCWGQPFAGPTRFEIGSVSAIAVGARRFCGLGSGGVLHCGGSNQCGQLGVPPNTMSKEGFELSPLPIAGSAGSVGLGAFGRFCALRSGGTLECWGTESDDCASLSPISGLMGVDQLALGASHGCALDATALRCWGSSWYGQLGNGVAFDVSVTPPAPVAL